MLSRRRFLQSTIAGLAFRPQPGRTIAADVAIIGGGTGGCAAALAALSMNCKVIMTEPTDWIGGQFTQQGVPPDENSWIESFGGTQSYLKFRSAIRRYYRQAYPLRLPELENLNPGACGVSRLCHEPHVALAVFRQLLAPYISSGQLTIITQATPAAASISADRVESVRLKGTDTTIAARFFLDATEDGALLPLTGTEYVQGAEEDSEELHASQRPGAANMQAPTWCFAMEYRPGEDHTITRPASYDFLEQLHSADQSAVAGKTVQSHLQSSDNAGAPERHPLIRRPGAETEHFNLWTYRRLIDPALFEPGTYAGGISLVNWPQNDYIEGNLFGDHDVAGHLQQARELSRALFYWLQTEVPA